MREVTSIRLRRRLVLAAVAALVALVALPAAGSATMPGGNGRIAFEKFVEKNELLGEVDIWSMNPDGSGVVPLTSGEDSYEGTYSPDGSRLAFGRYDQILVAGADGSNPRIIDAGSTEQTIAADRWVANYADPETGTVYPWVKIEERREVRDTRSEPSFSPDGAALAVAHYTSTYISEFACSVNANNDPNCNGAYEEYFYDCQDCGSSIETIDSNTGALLATFVPKVSGVYLSNPSFSRTGAVAYVREAEAATERQVLSVASPGGAATVLAAGTQVRDPDFSPDGSHVAFVAGNHEIGIVAATGGAPTVIPVPPPLASSKVWLVRSPVWSPDGSSLAFGNLGGSGGGFEPLRDGGVFLMRPDGSGMTPLHGAAAVPTGWQPLPPPAAVRARAVKGKKKVRLSKKGIAVVGKVVCGSTPCALKAAGAKLKVGKKRFGVKAILPKSLAPGTTGKVKFKVKRKAIAALKARRAGKLRLGVRVSEGSGTMIFRFAPKVLPPKQQKKRGSGGGER